MKEKRGGIKKYLLNPWTISIFGTAIGTWLAGIIFGKNFIGKIFGFLGSIFSARFSVPVWLLIIIALFIPAVLLVLLSRAGSSNKQSGPPAWKSYNKDTFDGIVWRWGLELYGNQIEIEHLTPFCPECDCQLKYAGSRSLECPNCGFADNDYRKAELDLRLLILRNVRQRYLHD